MRLNAAVHLNKMADLDKHPSLEANKAVKAIERLYLDPDASTSLKELDNPRSIQLYIGPEGGFSERDIQIMQSEMTGVQLGKRILRTETAGLVAVAALQSLFGDI